jgi:hypothetical protein
VTVLVQQDSASAPPVRQTGYRQDLPTFADPLARLRRELWYQDAFRPSAAERELVKIPRALLERRTETLAYAA